MLLWQCRNQDNAGEQLDLIFFSSVTGFGTRLHWFVPCLDFFGFWCCRIGKFGWFVVELLFRTGKYDRLNSLEIVANGSGTTCQFVSKISFRLMSERTKHLEETIMALSIGIVGLPNVGKSTLFNALTKAQTAAAANYPFCTIEPNKAIVAVPDRRLDELSDIVNPQKVQNAVVEFTDIAGLVKGASRGEGLGNQFLSHIRETSAIVHVVRCFESETIIHVDGTVNPLRDIEVINTELVLADIQTMENTMTRLEKQARGDKKMQPLLNTAGRIIEHLNSGRPASSFEEKDSDAFLELTREIRLISSKPVIYAANVDEEGLAQDNEYVKAVRKFAAEQNSEAVKICAKIEEEMAGMIDEERKEFLTALGIAEGGLDQIIHHGYHALGLISYFTAGVKEVRAWTIERGWKAPKAASVIHDDFERGFIRAEVIGFDDFVAAQGEAGARSIGKLRTEGKEYVVNNGDVMHFLFNV
jgi:ribosome-binding ATPase